MKSYIAGLFGFVLLLAAATAYTQISQTMKVKVPFPFFASGKQWPSAEYTIKITQPTGLITLSAVNVGSAIVMSNKDELPGMENGKSYMQFVRYGDSWVLNVVTYDGTCQVLHRSKARGRGKTSCHRFRSA